MKILPRYIAKTLLQSILLTALVLMGIEFFLLFISELDDIGHGHYTLLQAIFYVALQLPAQLYQLFPIVSLIGALIGLGYLAANSELTVMRASGFSMKQIISSVLLAVGLLILVIGLSGEMLVPETLAYSHYLKASKTSGEPLLRLSQGLWLREKEDFIYIDKVIDKKTLENVSLYHFNHNQLTGITIAKSARYSDEAWMLYQVSFTQFLGSKISLSETATMPWKNFHLKPKALLAASSDPN